MEGISGFERGRYPFTPVGLSAQTITFNIIIKPVVQRPGICIQPRLVCIVPVPSAVKPHTVTVNAPL